MNTVNKDMRDAEKNLAGLEKCCGLCSCPWQKVSFKNWIRIIFSNWGSELINPLMISEKMHYAMHNNDSLWFLTLRHQGRQALWSGLFHGLLTLTQNDSPRNLFLELYTLWFNSNLKVRLKFWSASHSFSNDSLYNLNKYVMIKLIFCWS